MKANESNDILFQRRPKTRNRPLCYREHQWHTIEGAINEADKLSRCVMWARKHYFENEFTYFASINITEDVTAKRMQDLWKNISRRLSRKKVIALWVIEVSRRSNHFNYHMLFRSRTSDLKSLLKFAFKELRTNIKVDRFDPQKGRFAVHYMTKAKIPLYIDGELRNEDRWGKKRVLFRKELKIRKFGTVGKFWPKKKELLWKEVQEVEKRIRDNLHNANADDYIDHLYDYIQGYFPIKKIRRCVGYHGVPTDWLPDSQDW